MPVFPYYKTPDGMYFPVVPVGVAYRRRIWSIQVLVDSGATMSIFQREIAERLGLEIEDGTEVYLGGVGGRIRGYTHSLRLMVAGRSVQAPVVFSHEYTVSFNILGRQDVFRNFLITFDERKRQTSFTVR